LRQFCDVHKVRNTEVMELFGKNLRRIRLEKEKY